MKYFQLGKPRAISQGFPFNNHRTMAQVMADERRAKDFVKRVAAKFTAWSFA